ncbi:MAG: 4Fe-4S dicluster domain-containing protein [Verrucomicrobiota bacterium]|nr:4Fe-4S dicluster domain-containing protein [Verrucomicrobiota bacterium]
MPLNGLDEDEIWRNVGVIVGGTVEQPYQQTVTTACHHCAEPGCLLGCPVTAYEKDAATGIVRHLADQCIGCQYCLLKCPYDVPKYSKKRGIVRKCDMCYNRLAADEAPACVQACPSGAITIRIASAAETRAQAEPGVRLIHGAFGSSYTKPTTSYTTRKAIPANAHPGDVYRLRLEDPHWPLIGCSCFRSFPQACSSASRWQLFCRRKCLQTLPLRSRSPGLRRSRRG